MLHELMAGTRAAHYTVASISRLLHHHQSLYHADIPLPQVGL